MDEKPKQKRRRRGKNNTTPLKKIARLRITPVRLRKLMEEGWTDKKLADFTGYDPDTIKLWKKNKDFAKILEESKEVSDKMVLASMFHNACGYHATEYTYERVYNKDPETKKVKDSFKLTKKVVKFVPGDVKAQEFWLTNRQRDEWRKDHKQVGVTNNHTLVLMAPGFDPEHLPETEKYKLLNNKPLPTNGKSNGKHNQA